MSALVDALLQHIQHQPGAQALGWWHAQPRQRQTLSYGEFGAAVETLARALVAHTSPGARVLLLFEPGLEFALAFWACLRAGRVAVPTYPPADPRTRSRFLEIAKDAQAELTLTSRAILKQSQLVRWLMGSLRRMRWLSVEDLTGYTGTEALPTSPDDSLALLQYTSGSTATPRGVMLSHANLYANVMALNAARIAHGERDEHFVCWVPLYHDMGLISGVVMPLVLGFPSTLLSPLHFLQQPVRWLQALHDCRGTISAGPNFAYALCLRRIKPEQRAELDLSHWRVALNGAEQVMPDTLRQFTETFAPCGLRPETLYPSYGLAESTVFVAGNACGTLPVTLSVASESLQQHRVVPLTAETEAAGLASRTLVSVGQTWGAARLRVVDPDTQTLCSEAQIGEIWLQGPSIGRGYWQRPDDTAQTFAAQLAGEDGHWLRTGDLGFVWQGQLFVTGRIKELLILNGQNYYPEPIEQAVQAADPDFRTGCGAAFAVGQNPEQLVLVQEVRKQSRQSPQVLLQKAREAINQSLGLPLSQLALLPAGTLPKTSSGKVQRRRCQQAYLKGKYKRWIV
ncbi:MAG: fatty acyl-AMP ligase [Candidatus Sericytochromatia bacterium]|nr:fatty acyl-AMP ligase [Candidatus Sericytochromatia bacterium]